MTTEKELFFRAVIYPNCYPCDGKECTTCKRCGLRLKEEV